MSSQIALFILINVKDVHKYIQKYSRYELVTFSIEQRKPPSPYLALLQRYGMGVVYDSLINLIKFQNVSSMRAKLRFKFRHALSLLSNTAEYLVIRR